MYLHTLFFCTPFSFYAFPFFYTFTLCLLSSGSVLAILCFFLLPALLLFDTSFVSSIAFACSSRKFPKAAARSAGTIQQAGYKYRRFPFFGDSRQTPKIKNTGKNSSIDVYLLFVQSAKNPISIIHVITPGFVNQLTTGKRRTVSIASTPFSRTDFKFSGTCT